MEAHTVLSAVLRGQGQQSQAGSSRAVLGPVATAAASAEPVAVATLPALSWYRDAQLRYMTHDLFSPIC